MTLKKNLRYIQERNVIIEIPPVLLEHLKKYEQEVPNEDKVYFWLCCKIFYIDRKKIGLLKKSQIFWKFSLLKKMNRSMVYISIYILYM